MKRRIVRAVHWMKECAMPQKREKIEPHQGASRYVRRDAAGQFTGDQVSVGASLQSDRKQRAKTVAPKGQGDRGDQRRSAGKGKST
jgi:hypothetical protein